MKARKILSLVLAVLMVLPMMMPAVSANEEDFIDGGWDGVTVDTNFEGAGTSANPWKISSAEELAGMAQLMNDDATVSDWIGDHYQLTADIDLNGKEWTPIGSAFYADSSHRFTGTFNGGGYTISGFYIGECKPGGSGLFGIAAGGTITNFTLRGRVEAGALAEYSVAEAADVKSLNSAPGASMLIPIGYGTKVSDVTIYADMDIQKHKHPTTLYAGVFCGYSSGISLTNCKAYGTLTLSVGHNSYSNVGGLVSHAKAVTMTGCVSDVDLYVKNGTSAGVYVGGLLGDSYADTAVTNLTTITNDTLYNSLLSASTTEEKATLIQEYVVANNKYNANVGKINITGCAYTGDIYAYSSGDVLAGGLIGVAGRGTATVNNVTYTIKSSTDATGKKYTIQDFTYPSIGGIVNIKNCFHDGAIYAHTDVAGKTVYTAPMIGINRAYKATFENFFTTADVAAEDIYNLQPKAVYDRPATMPSGLVYKMNLLDKGGHVTGISVRSESGAAIRMVEGSTGMRFTSMIDQDLYNTLVEKGLLTKMGTLITPTGYVEGAGSFTKESLDAYKTLMQYEKGYIDVEFKHTDRGGEHEWLKGYYPEKYVTDYCFSGAISNIKEQNYNRSFSGIGYLTITSGGYSHTFYADYNDAAKARTVSYVATKALEDTKTEKDETYQYDLGNGTYSRYSDTQRGYINAFATKYDSTFNTNLLDVIKNDASDYTIVYPLGSAKERDLAIFLQQAIYQRTGIALNLRESYDLTGKNAKEIVIGCEERGAAYNYSTNSLAENSYRIFTDNNRIVILGNSNEALGSAVLKFISNYFDAYNGTNVSIARFIEHTGEGTVAPISLSGYKISYTADNEIEQRMAYSLRDAIAMATGATLNYDKLEAGKSGTKDVYFPVRELNEGIQLTVTPSAASGKRIVYKTNTELTNGDYRITTTGDVILVEAGSYLGFEGAEDYILIAMKYGVAALTTNGFAMDSNFKYSLNRLEESSKYAYEKAGSTRVMFYNVLFNDTAEVNKTNIIYHQVPTADRNRLQAAMIAEYMPDVLGCQEFNYTKRNGAKDKNGNSVPADSLVTLLQNLGYEEAIDPRVHNAGASKAAVYTDPITGTISYGWGTSGAYSVTVNGSTYYTYYNNTPIFYNKETTTKIDAGYYWYQAQTDEENDGDLDKYKDGDNKYSEVVSNSSGDAGSKSATWGVFQNKATGEKYIVVSTHMCTRSNGIRALQAAELVNLINKLIETFGDLPVILGGDMNGTSTGKNIRYFIDQAGFEDVVFENSATEFTSQLRTSHGYPDLDPVDTDVNIMQPGSTESTMFTNDSIDRILLKNADNVLPQVFGVISDDCSRSAGDHYPIFLDFSFEGPTEEPEWSERY